jgi:hypothetical protein
MSDKITNTPMNEEDYLKLIKQTEEDHDSILVESSAHDVHLRIKKSNLRSLKQKTLSWLIEHAKENSGICTSYEKDNTWEELFNYIFSPVKLV